MNSRDLLEFLRERTKVLEGLRVEQAVGVIGPDQNGYGVFYSKLLANLAVNLDFGGIGWYQGMAVGSNLQASKARSRHPYDEAPQYDRSLGIAYGITI